MKKQILIFTALLVAVFFTACEQDALVEPVEDITQVEQSVNPPQEAMDALEILIDSDFAEPEIEERCNDDHYGIIAEGGELSAGTLCGVKLSFYGGSTSGAPATWFYYHVDEENTNGQYKLIDWDWKYGYLALWGYKDFSNVAINSSCKWRAYLYAWDASCGPNGKWKRLAEEEF